MGIEMESSLTVILPTLNEEQTIGLVIDEIRSLPVRCDILVVDSSTDDTSDIATKKGVRVIRAFPLGKGHAMRIGFGEVATPYIIMMDSDFTYPAIYILPILKKLMGGYDAVVTYRKWKVSGSMTFTNAFGNKVLSKLASRLYGIEVRDVCSGMWGFRKEALDKFTLKSKGFTLEAELFSNMAEYKLGQEPIVYRCRPYGSKAKLKVWDGFKIGWFLIKKKWKQ